MENAGETTESIYLRFRDGNTITVFSLSPAQLYFGRTESSRIDQTILTINLDPSTYAHEPMT